MLTFAMAMEIIGWIVGLIAVICFFVLCHNVAKIKEYREIEHNEWAERKQRQYRIDKEE